MANRFYCFVAATGLLTTIGCTLPSGTPSKPTDAVISSRAIELISVDGRQFRDLNKNGQLDPYEDWRLPNHERAEDLLGRMTTQEKLGQMAHSNIFPDKPFGQPATGYNQGMVNAALAQGITHFIPHVSLSGEQFAKQNNTLQSLGESTRLGLPITVSTDPRHHFLAVAGASFSGNGFSVWPEPLGLAAINEPELTRRFAEIARAEYRAVGFNQALSPQADLASEPRWPRQYGTFGADADIAKAHVSAYIRGFQGSDRGVVAGGVSAVVKHWVGYGAAKDGWDSHNYYGRYAALDSADLATHVTPFEGAFEAGVSGVMPAYSIFSGLSVDGRAAEATGAGFSTVLLQDLLRDAHGYDGVILSDWLIFKDCSSVCRDGHPPGEYPSPEHIATPWGVMDLSETERLALAINAGVDQFGGLMTTATLAKALEKGLITQERVDQSVLRVLKKTFATGLFDNPFVDESKVAQRLNTPQAAALALTTQARSIVVLKRDTQGPLLAQPGQALYLHNADPGVFTAAGHRLVDDPSQAEVAIVRLDAPYETLHPNYFFGSKHHEGSLAFAEQGEVIELLRGLSEKVRVIVDISLDRPAILTNILPMADALVANFGASDSALLKALDGSITPVGKLPFELPVSMAAVQAQNSGRPADSGTPLFPLHYRAPVQQAPKGPAQQSTPESSRDNAGGAPPPPTPIQAWELPSIDLYPAAATRPTDQQWERFFGQAIIRNVRQPALYPVLPAPQKRNGKAVIIAPGGGYQFVSIENEGIKVARRLADEGYTAFVLKYRTQTTPRDAAAAMEVMGKQFMSLGKSALPDYPPAVDDLAAALAKVSADAATWQLDPEAINVIGFSAGARTSIRLLERDLQIDSINSVALLYPPMINTIGKGDRPPMFMAIAADDPLFIQGGMNMAEKWWRETGSIEFHVYSAGQHGFGMSASGTTSEGWIDQYLRWLEQQ